MMSGMILREWKWEKGVDGLVCPVMFTMNDEVHNRSLAPSDCHADNLALVVPNVR